MSAGAFGQHTPSKWASLSRSSCSECGAGIRWGRVRDLPWEVAPGDRLRVFELVDFVGPFADAWTCEVCPGWGVFQSPEVVWL